MKERVKLTPPQQLREAVERRQLKAEETGELLDVFIHQRLLLLALPTKDLPEQSRNFVEFLNSVQYTDDSTNGPFRNNSVHLIAVNAALNHRLKIASVWLRIEQDIRLGQGDVSHIRTASTNDEHVFASSAGLYDGTIVLDAYISPLLAAGSPGIWAINIPRTFGSLLFNLGTFLPGTVGDAAEMLQLVTTPGARDAVEFPRLSASACPSALEWWTERLNALFSILSDLSTFTDSTGDYRAAKHLESLLTVEQIFRRTTSMLVAHRDANARRALFFTILDSLVGIRGVSLLNMCTYSHAAKVLSRLESSISVEAAEILLPAARRAVTALLDVQSGFFIRRQLSTEKVDLRLDAGEVRPLSLEDAAARYLKVLRDATHGHGSDKESARGVTDALLAHHDGHIPHDIGLLGYLYLLDVLENSERTRRLLYRNGK